MFSDKDKVKANQLLADWDPYTLPIIAEKDGFIKFVDLKQGVSFRESVDDTTGISNKIIMDWSQNPKTKNLKPSISIVKSLDQEINSNELLKLNYPMSIDTIIGIEDGTEVKAGHSGVVANINVKEGDSVTVGQVLLSLA